MRFSEAGLFVVPDCLLHACLEGVARSKTEIFLGFGRGKNPRRLDHRPPYSPTEMDTDDACGLENIDDPGRQINDFFGERKKKGCSQDLIFNGKNNLSPGVVDSIRQIIDLSDSLRRKCGLDDTLNQIMDIDEAGRTGSISEKRNNSSADESYEEFGFHLPGPIHVGRPDDRDRKSIPDRTEGVLSTQLALSVSGRRAANLCFIRAGAGRGWAGGRNGRDVDKPFEIRIGVECGQSQIFCELVVGPVIDVWMG